MAPTHSRQFLVWSLPTIAVILSYLWYKKKRIGAQSDPGEKQVEEEIYSQSIKAEVREEKKSEEVESTPEQTPRKSFNRSLSGVETTPIDIVIPRELRRSKSKSQPVVISDEDLDLEIEKIRSMKNSSIRISPPLGKTPSPQTVKSEKQSPQSPVIETFCPVKQSSVQSPVKIKDVNESLPIVIKKLASPPQPTQTNKQRKSKKGRRQANMAQKDIAVVEEKLTSLKINKEAPKRDQKIATSKRERSDSQRRSSERDSANHSPADAMLASPSLSSISDNNSEKSTDSGKGGSDPATPPPHHALDSTEAGPSSATTDQRTIFEFLIPQQLVGKLIGRQGSFLANIKDRTNALIIVHKHPGDKKVKICSIEGTDQEIQKALKMIRNQFPAKRYPEVTLEQVHFMQPVEQAPLIPDHLYLKLIEGINNDTILSCMVAPNHLFLQQPMHPTFPGLNMLTAFMNQVYADEGLPSLPNPVPANTVCVAYSVDSWYRAVTLSTDEENGTSYVKFLDYGGYVCIENSKLRQIRGDFLLLPFQAAECMLANIKPAGEDGIWADGAYQLVADVTKGGLIYTQILDYTEDGGVPLVFCYIVGQSQPIYLNQLLVDQGFAEWLPGVYPAQEEPVPIASTSSLLPVEGTA